MNTKNTYSMVSCNKEKNPQTSKEGRDGNHPKETDILPNLNSPQ